MRQVPQYVIGQVDPIGFINVPDAKEITSHPRIEPIIAKVEQALVIHCAEQPDVVIVNGVEYRP